MKALHRLIGIVRGLLLVALTLDTVLVGWLVFSAESVQEMVVGLLVSLLIPGGLYILLGLLERVAYSSAEPGRHSKRTGFPWR